MNNKLTFALAQFPFVEGEKKTNLEKALHFISKSALQGADIVLLPEMFLTGYPSHIKMAQIAETLSGGESILLLQAAAKEHKIAITGSYPEWDPISSKVYNTAFFIGADGEMLASYRKIHLFDRESQYVSPGNELVTVDYRGVRLGLLICYDLEFPEPARALALMGAQILIVVSANMEPYGLYHRIFAQARAIENHMIVAYCNRTGSNNAYRFVGESCLVDPFGHILCELGEEEALAVGTVDLGMLAKSKDLFNYLNERKTF